MKMPIILLFAGQYSFTDERTGELRSGTTCFYYFDTDLIAKDNTDGTKGQRPAKSMLDYHAMSMVGRAPAYYEADFEMKVDSKGKPILTVVGLEYLSDLKVVAADAGQEEAKPEKEPEPPKGKKAV